MSNQLFDLAGKVCLVTGASSGLGAHIAKVLAGAGGRVLGISRSLPETAGVADDNAGAVEHHECDVTDGPAIEAFVKETGARVGPISVLVNNAGISALSDLDGRAGTHSETGQLFDVNFFGPARVAECVARQLVEKGQGGSIINVTSFLAGGVMPKLAYYSASKAALEHMTRQQAAQWGRHGIRVNALAPGWFDTAMTADFLEKGYSSVIRGQAPLRRVGVLNDLDGPVLLLASDASKYMTGSVVTVDGGIGIN